MVSNAWLVAIVLVTSEAAVGQLSVEDIAALEARGRAEGWTFRVAPNPATERPLEELCGLIVPKDLPQGATVTSAYTEAALPVSFDWRAQGGCTPVRNQLDCGGCWAFATVAPLECAIKIKDGISVDLSEQWLISCNREGYGCSSGWFAHDYHQSKTDSCGGTGAVREADFPYANGPSPCGCPYPHPYRIDAWAYVQSASGVASTSAIKQAILNYGPVSSAICINFAFQAYDGGVYNECAPGTVNHAVTLVGWDDSQGSQGVWIVRNSWGTAWGEDGYMRIEYGCSSVGYGACYVAYAGVDVLQVLPVAGLKSSGPEGGPFEPFCLTYTLTNTGTTTLNWTATKAEPWLDVAPAGGSLGANASVSVNVCVNAIAEELPVGNYTDTVTFTNSSTGKTRNRPVMLQVGHIDYFTEFFDQNDNDLDNQTVRFTPVGGANFYEACRESAAAFPTDPTGGTPLSLQDDSYAPFVLGGGSSVLLYGEPYSTIYVGSNGYVTFTEGDSSWVQALGPHFRLPRISALFNDLNPSSGGQVSWKQLSDRAVVTFENVPEAGTSKLNSFQIEMLFDGRLTITWLNIAATSGLAGLSKGEGTPTDLFESNLSEYGHCRFDADEDLDGDVDLADFLSFQGCFRGPNCPFPLDCDWADLDDDNDADLEDFLVFQRCFNGPNRSPKAACPW